MSQPKSSTPTPTLATCAPTAAAVARAQTFASQLLRAAHDAGNTIDRAVRIEREAVEGQHPPADSAALRSSSRMCRLRAFGHAQDCKVLARRMLDALAGVVPDESDADVLLAAAAVLARGKFEGLFGAELRVKSIELLEHEAARMLDASPASAEVVPC